MEQRNQGVSYIQLVDAFHKKYGHFCAVVPGQAPDNVWKLREDLIAEEARELVEAMQARDLVKIADGMADLLYVVFGAALALDIPIEAAYWEVHASNMTKSMLKDEKSTPGKTLKGPNYRPPNLERIMKGYAEYKLAISGLLGAK